MNAKKTGLNISKRKSKVMHAATVQIKIHGEPLDHVEQFTYLGSVISINNSLRPNNRESTGSRLITEVNTWMGDHLTMGIPRVVDL